ncbi:hypothetical protein B0T24DRAFT_674433 [Lasiosphaeria ovina]|uniref:Uncharacterized protein n=1 Tax=Lasiosphaeria ovina TaxID=92902 RepID=A0AAE0NNC5_9PEZI|nr:hypothetical protein B0T24DRAFT_674433 [Lasiosphaeria ovina]
MYRYLWKDYWQRFNTITIPLLDEDAFFSDALAAARAAQSRTHLEELLGEKSKERRKELEQLIPSIGLAAVSLATPFPSETARLAAAKVGRTGSLDSLLQFVGGAIWGLAESDDDKDGKRDASGSQEGQLDEYRPPDEDSYFDFTGTQDGPYSPYPIVSDTWDLADHGIDRWVTELPASPGKRQLPPPTSLRTCGMAARVEGGEVTDGVRHGAPDESRKSPTTLTETESAADVMVPLQSPAILQSAKGSPTDLTPLSASVDADASPTLVMPQTTPKTPSNPLSGEDMAQQLFKQKLATERGAIEGETGYPSRGSLLESSKARRKRPLDELENSDAEDEGCKRRLEVK